MHIRKGGSAYKYQVVLEQATAIAFIKSVGFQPTDNPDIFQRPERRSSHNTVIGQRYMVFVDLAKMSANPSLWRAFVRRNAQYATEPVHETCPVCGGPWKRGTAEAE